MSITDESLLSKVASRLSQPPAYAKEGAQASILAAAGMSYGWYPRTDDAAEGAFDPEAAALFEAMVEGAYLVANADGEFDQAERAAFQHVVVLACGGSVAERQVQALLADLAEQLGEDGMDKRIDMVSRIVSRPDHAREVLRIAALLAHVSGGVSDVEREVLEKLVKALALTPDVLQGALGDAEKALAS